MADIGRSVQQVVTLQEEIKLHIEFCKEYGLEVADIERQQEDQGVPPLDQRDHSSTMRLRRRLLFVLGRHKGFPC